MIAFINHSEYNGPNQISTCLKMVPVVASLFIREILLCAGKDSREFSTCSLPPGSNSRGSRDMVTAAHSRMKSERACWLGVHGFHSARGVPAVQDKQYG